MSGDPLLHPPDARPRAPARDFVPCTPYVRALYRTGSSSARKAVQPRYCISVLIMASTSVFPSEVSPTALFW
jgi:hypothetical protein